MCKNCMLIKCITIENIYSSSKNIHASTIKNIYACSEIKNDHAESKERIMRIEKGADER